MYFWMTNITYCATVVLFISVAVISILLKSPDAAKIQDGLGIFLIVVHVVVFVLMMVVIRIGTKDFLKKYKESKNMNKEVEMENNRILELVEIGDDSNVNDIETGNVITNPMLNLEKRSPSPKHDNIDIGGTSSAENNMSKNSQKSDGKIEKEKKIDTLDFKLPNKTRRRRKTRRRNSL